MNATPAGPTLTTTVDVLGPWSVDMSARFWENFTPAALPNQTTRDAIQAVFLSETDWTRVECVIRQDGANAEITVHGPGNLKAATEQVRRFLSIDVDARDWPAVGDRDPIINEAQKRFPGLRPCGFYSPYEAAVWAVLSQRLRMTEAATISKNLLEEHGNHAAFPSPAVLRKLDVDLPGRKMEYLHEVADAALSGRLSGPQLRAAPTDTALADLQTITGIGPFGADLILIRGAGAPDVFPRHEKIIRKTIADRYGAPDPIDDVIDTWRPFRAWAVVHLRVMNDN